MSKQPIKCIRLIPFWIVKIPNDAEVVKIRREIIFPLIVKSEKIRIIMRSIERIVKDRVE